MATGNELAGKVALISGGGRERGQGAAEGRLFAAHGATVVLADVVGEEGERTAGSIAGAEYAPLDPVAQPMKPALVQSNKCDRGFSHQMLARLLCPNKYLAIFDKDTIRYWFS